MRRPCQRQNSSLRDGSKQVNWSGCKYARKLSISRIDSSGGRYLCPIHWIDNWFRRSGYLRPEEGLEVLEIEILNRNADA